MKRTTVFFILIAAISILVLLVGYFEVQKLITNERVSEALPTVSEIRDAPDQATQIDTQQTGQLVRVDAAHYGSGTVRILKTPDENRYVRFEDNVEIANGPDLYVYVSDTINPGNDLDTLGNFVDLGKLKGNIGSQNYILPTNLPFEPKTVIVWCKRFDVLFTYAVMQ